MNQATTKFFNACLPFVTVFLCIGWAVTYSNYPGLLARLYSLHHDPFTIQRSLDGLKLGGTMLPAILGISFILFSLFQSYLPADRRGWWQRRYCLLAVLFTFSLALRLWQCPFAQDDSYIDYRYVQHWLAGQFDYNAGEHVMGFTSHLHLLILWLVCSLFHTTAVDLVSYYLNVAVDTVNTLFLFFVASKLYRRSLPAFVASLCYAVSSYNCSQTIAGKETAIVNLILLMSIYALHTSRIAILPWCANALFLLRPEGVFACLITLATALKTGGKQALKSCIVPCAITCAWYGFLLFYFGSILPHGMIAKHKVLLPGDFFLVFMGCISLAGNVMTNSSFFTDLPGMQSWPFFSTTLAIFAYTFWRFKLPSLVLYRNIALAQLALLSVVQARVFSWYFCWFALLLPLVMAQLTADAGRKKEVKGTGGGQTVPLPTVEASAKPTVNDSPLEAPGSPAQAQPGAATKGETPEVPSGAGQAPGAIPGQKLWPIMIYRMAIILLLLGYLRSGFFFAPFAWLPYLERGVAYREAALYIQEKSKGKALVASSDIGILGYYYNGPVLDLMGLISTEPLKYYPIKNNPGLVYLIPPKAVADFKPKYLMAPLGHVYGMLLNDEDFKSHYTELKTWTNPMMTDGVVYVWERNDDAPHATPQRN